MRFGIIGYGSIGKRHVNNLISLGFNRIILFRSISNDNEYSLTETNDLDQFLNSGLDAVILANPTSLHAKYLHKILIKNINVLVEKPIISSNQEYKEIKSLLKKYKGIGMTGYNMRYHPCVSTVKNIIKEKTLGKIFSARFFVGQYLPDWRPKMDYSKSYSSRKKMGGGVLFDLVHEIDLALYLTGIPTGEILSKVGKVSKLSIDSEDMAEILYSTNDNKFISIHLDYLSKKYKRYIEIIGKNGNLYADLHDNKVSWFNLKNQKQKKFPSFSKNDMYLNLISDFIKCIQRKIDTKINLEDGLISNQIALGIRSKFYNEK